MTFIESVRTCFLKYADFNGRATRSEYWWWTLFILIASLALGVISESLVWAFTIATFLPYIAVTTRRLHDTNRSGWRQLVGLVPLLGWAILMYWYVQASKDPNRYGDRATTTV